MILNLRQRFILFVCLAVFGMVVAGTLGGFIMNKWPDSTPAMRIASVCQSMFQLIIPAVATAMLVTRRPATFLAVDRRMDRSFLLLSLAILVAAIPAMNWLIKANAGLTLPDSMASIEGAMRQLEQRAASSITLLQGAHTPMNLVVNILIIGLLAGFGEELFFRGAFMRLLTTGGINRHLAIWAVAFVFSAMHLQFFGFFPRLLLGAYFGYLLSWSRCLWIPVLVHAANNIIYVLSQYFYGTADDSAPLDAIGTDGSLLLPIVSIIITVVLFRILYRCRVTTE